MIVNALGIELRAVKLAAYGGKITGKIFIRTSPEKDAGIYVAEVFIEGEAAAGKYSAKPGQSEHQTGLAVDVSSESVDYLLSDDYGETKEGKWLAENAHRFGFIVRFPRGKEDITGYQYEPWHIRYVGLTAAKEIHAEGITLEEYLKEIDIDQ